MTDHRKLTLLIARIVLAIALAGALLVTICARPVHGVASGIVRRRGASTL